MDYLLDNWGSFIGVAGLVITILGVIISYLAFRRAGKARDAAAAAEVASKETRAAMPRSLTTVDLERAIALAQRLKELHRLGRWDTALECYHLLQAMLGDIATWHPAPTDELRDAFSNAIQLIQEMEAARGHRPGARRRSARVRRVQLSVERNSGIAARGCPLDTFRSRRGKQLV